MVSERLSPTVRTIRGALVRLASAAGPARRIMAVAGRELSQAAELGAQRADRRRLSPDEATLYGGSYFGEGRDPTGDRQGRSGYASYDRVSSNADIAAHLIWRNFRVHKTLDVGCAKGFLVEALRELGVDAHGCDVSAYALEHATAGAQGFVKIGDLLDGLSYADNAFQLVSALEILEHLAPDQVPRALTELRRVCGGIVYATIPSFGPNRSGPDGHFEGKVRPEQVARYRSFGPGYLGPIPAADLAVDADGHPIEGHLTVASFDWWTARFAEAGFERWVEVERRLYADIEPAGLGPFWNLYVFAIPGTAPTMATPHRPEATLVELGLTHPLLEDRSAPPEGPLRSP